MKTRPVKQDSFELFEDVTLLWQHKSPCADVAFRHNFAVEGVKLDRMGIHASLGGRVLRFDMIYPTIPLWVATSARILLPSWVRLQLKLLV